ncbi:MAG: hypothetical protein QOD75_518 [Blastocatellia bacterium]|jgi:hypothetical protein|nr:hypothetical protein [Blastocatellia bacterium]
MERPYRLVNRKSERGGARANLLIFILVAASLIYGGYLYIPVAYDAYLFKDLMQHNVDVAVTQGYQPAWVQEQLTKSLTEYNVPANAVITPSQRDNRVEVRVQFTRPISLPGYTYDYEFDHTARSTAFLTIK